MASLTTAVQPGQTASYTLASELTVAPTPSPSPASSPRRGCSTQWLYRRARPGRFLGSRWRCWRNALGLLPVYSIADSVKVASRTRLGSDVTYPILSHLIPSFPSGCCVAAVWILRLGEVRNGSTLVLPCMFVVSIAAAHRAAYILSKMARL